MVLPLYTDASFSKLDKAANEVWALAKDFERYYRALALCDVLGIDSNQVWQTLFLEQTGIQITTGPLDFRLVDPVKYTYALLKVPELVEVVDYDPVTGVCSPRT